MSVSCSSVTAGGSLTVTVTVKNQGTATAAATTTMIRINNTAGSSSPSDPIQNGRASRRERGESSATVSATFKNSKAGTYYAHDYWDNHSVLSQSNTANDTYLSGAISVSAAGQPD